METDALFDAFDEDGSGAIDYRELHRQLRMHSRIEIDACLQAGAMGDIETEAKNKHALRTDGPKDVAATVRDHARSATTPRARRLPRAAAMGLVARN